MANYIENQRFLEILEIYKTTKCQKAFNEIGRNLLKIATNFLNKPLYINQPKYRKDEIISDAVDMMLSKVIDGCFNKDESSNPFGYFTQICFNAVQQNFNNLNKHKKRTINISYIENFDGGDE